MCGTRTNLRHVRRLPGPDGPDRRTRGGRAAGLSRIAVLIAAALALPAFAQPELQASTTESDTGEYRLRWPEVGGQEVVLEEATSEDFADARVLYQGVDAATVVSGRLDGTYHYRLRLKDGPWGAPLAVHVVHHSAAEAFGFLALGGVVFLATAVLIVAGHRRHRREMGGAA